MSAASDRNLLFGVLALQIDAITADQLIQGMHGWVADKSRTLGELLLEQGALGRDQFTALEALVGARIRMFDNDPTESLAYLSSAGAVARLLCRVQDRELDASLQVMGAEREPNRDNGTIDERSHGYQRSTGSSTDGRFRIQRLHDEGGLGRVFVAEDTELGRQVALKELKETIAHDSASRTRFLTEAEITGGLEHPGIVPVYGLGHYDDGRPFYAMRFIQGDNLQVKIREYHETDWSKHGGVSAKSIELRRLLGRFIDVCEAIHYAHKRGVLHRDLKPGNIMAGRYGETLVVDWGLAKWLGQREFASDESSLDEEATLLPPSGSHASATRLGSAVGTPAFMSPEQARGEHDRLGPATDIYGLGATLYMLLTNHRPYEGEVDVLAAACRGALVRPRSVNPSIPKPLESICLRAMAFQPHERYPSAQELAADVEQFLGDEPVTAYREGLSEQARRWLRKHSTLAATLLGIGLMAVVLLLVVGRLYQQLHHQERRTDEERQRKESVIELMVSAFQRTDPNQDGRTVTVAQVLDDTVNEMGNSDTDDGTKTELLYAIGRSYHNLGLYDQAINVLSESQRRASKLLGEDHLYTLPVASAIGEAYRQTGQYAKSIEMHKECLAQFRRQFGEKDRDTLKSLNNLAAAYEGAKQFDMAIPLFEQLLEQRREVLGSNDEDTLMSAVNLAKTYSDAGRETDAANMYLDSELEERIKRCFGEDHTVTNTYDNNRAVFFYSTHRLDQALTSFRSLLEFRRRVLGPEHPATLESMHNLGRCLESLGQLEEAESQYRAILELVDDTSRTVQLREWKALQSVQLQQRKFGDTLKTIAQWRDAMSDHPERSQNVPMAQISQAEALLGVGRVAEALAILRTTVPQLVESRPTWLETQRGQVLLGGALALTDDRDQSAELMLKAFQSLRIQLPEIDPHYRWYVARAAERLVELYRARKNAAQTSIWEPELARVNAEIIRLRNETPE